MKAWGITDKGRVRQQNQDAYAIRLFEDGGRAALVVCDGMGGARAGNVASSLAVETFLASLEPALVPGVSAEQVSDIAVAAVNRANAAVNEKAGLSDECKGMGTTLVSAVITGSQAVIVNVGDSRAYRITPGGIQRITKDHSLVEDMVERGDLTPEEARLHPSKNLITRALGTEPRVECDSFVVSLESGDFLLLCSDGLINQVRDQEILYEVLHGEDLPGCCGRLLDIALSRGAPDNVTVVLLQL
ncbi:Stp1/IreP family PP2C-type Ser/Thr phosphatase [Papillibacter cinnamivorans]|uniref:Protein phosphatase n=1 Tax=Papillibacter cinnamivorans DSM 12816 TaxID=1122930 RepID=A0A1W1YVX0_9FIRM|nr:Stp1/IreP family PP2C-type Ser/Thr phosphatase [Papillibacter cinnamivorans]SMC40329.1 protein phosphatase [Papillibacter cinnamivorans DSM 12816]